MSIHEQILKSMRGMAATFADIGINIDLPPPSGELLKTHYTAIEPGTSLSAEFAFNPKFNNPVRMFQGGMMCAAFDEVFGPLTYMVAGRPATTLEMSTSYMRPFTASDETFTIKADVVSKSKTLIFLRAEARTAAGKLLATATTHSLVMSDENLSRYQTPNIRK